MISVRPPSRPHASPGRHRWLMLVGVGLVTVATVVLAVALLTPESADRGIQVAGGGAAIVATALALTGVLVLLLHFLFTSFERAAIQQLELVVESNQALLGELARRMSADVELKVLGAVPPAQALDVVITNVYGRSDHNRELITSLLGGEGRQLDRSDLTISEHTEVGYRLQRVDDDNYQLFMQVGYSFKERNPVDTFIIFATSDVTLRDSIVLGCRQPLFELWFIPDEDPAHPLFHESVDGMLPSVRLGLSFLDDRGRAHELVDRHPSLTEVRVGRWEEYLAFFREPLGDLPRLRPEDYMGSLRVFEIELRDIVEPDVRVQAITQLSLRSMTMQRVDDGYCYWQAPYPCFLERMQIDAAPLSLNGGNEFLFRLQPFAIRSQPSPARWAPAGEVAELSVRSWLLPGHGVALLWKRVTDDGTAQR